MDTENTLAGAAESARVATEMAGGITLVLEIWSKEQRSITTSQQQEMRRQFRETHRLLGQAEQALEAQIREQVERKLADNGARAQRAPASGRGSRFHRRRNGVGAL